MLGSARAEVDTTATVGAVHVVGSHHVTWVFIAGTPFRQGVIYTRSIPRFKIAGLVTLGLARAGDGPKRIALSLPPHPTPRPH